MVLQMQISSPLNCIVLVLTNEIIPLFKPPLINTHAKWLLSVVILSLYRHFGCPQGRFLSLYRPFAFLLVVISATFEQQSINGFFRQREAQDQSLPVLLATGLRRDITAKYRGFMFLGRLMRCVLRLPCLAGRIRSHSRTLILIKYCGCMCGRQRERDRGRESVSACV